MHRVLWDALAEALAAGDVERKLALVRDLAADWAAGALSLAEGSGPATITLRGYPPRPELVAPDKVPRRNPGTPEGLAALFHSVVHIEWSAIDLALDHAYRFRGLPDDYYGDWIGVAAEEAGHFKLLRDHLRGFGHDYGDFLAHDSLWQMNLRTAHDVLVRMALVPRLMEARGLDATPPIRQKLARIGDQRGVEILEVIERDEIRHVALGDKWFRALCAERQVEPEATYRTLMEEFRAPRPIQPMNEKARRAAGFSEAELRALKGLGRTQV